MFKMGKNNSKILKSNGEYSIGDLKPCTGVQCQPPDIVNAVFIVSILISVVGSVCNLASIAIIMSSHLRKVPNNILVCQLNFINLIYCFLVMPLQAAQFRRSDNFMGVAFCKYMGAFRYWLSGVNIFLIGIIALYRSLQVTHHKVFRVVTQPNTFLSSCAVCYIIPTVYVAMPLAEIWGNFGFDGRILQCLIDEQTSGKYTQFMVIGHSFPVLLALFCYLYIVFYVRRHRRVSSHHVRIHTQPRSYRTTRRLYAIVTMTVGTFLFGVIPVAMVKSLDPYVRDPVAHLWGYMTLWITYVLNPAVYSITDIKFQTVVLRKIKRHSWKRKFSMTARKSIFDIHL